MANLRKVPKKKPRPSRTESNPGTLSRQDEDVASSSSVATPSRPRALVEPGSSKFASPSHERVIVEPTSSPFAAPNHHRAGKTASSSATSRDQSRVLHSSSPSPSPSHAFQLADGVVEMIHPYNEQVRILNAFILVSNDRELLCSCCQQQAPLTLQKCGHLVCETCHLNLGSNHYDDPNFCALCTMLGDMLKTTQQERTDRMVLVKHEMNRDMQRVMVDESGALVLKPQFREEEEEKQREKDVFELKISDEDLQLADMVVARIGELYNQACDQLEAYQNQAIAKFKAGWKYSIDSGKAGFALAKQPFDRVYDARGWMRGRFEREYGVVLAKRDLAKLKIKETQLMAREAGLNAAGVGVTVVGWGFEFLWWTTVVGVPLGFLWLIVSWFGNMDLGDVVAIAKDWAAASKRFVLRRG